MEQAERQLPRRLFVIGGNEDPDKDDMLILPRFVELAGGTDARLFICGAPTSEPDETLRSYEAAFKTIGVEEVFLLPMQDRSASETDEALEALERATAVFFTGGDQLHIAPRIAGTAFGERLEARYREGLLVAGTSAGAAVLSGTIVVRGEGETVRRAGVELAPGLALWPDAVIDTHFDRSGRVHRLLAVLAQHPGLLAVGLDEDTAVEVDPAGRFTVIGRGVAMVLDGRVTHTSADEAEGRDPIALFDVSLHVLPTGYGFDLHTKRPVVPESSTR